ncbi:MAG: hypothetical protein L6W00_16260 [Lentisphaeria bacterium]|nr:MAG: hypothetical protein L6W00_16260 [Lentisphaeria bacterium]
MLKPSSTLIFSDTVRPDQDQRTPFARFLLKNTGRQCNRLCFVDSQRPDSRGICRRSRRNAFRQ